MLELAQSVGLQTRQGAPLITDPPPTSSTTLSRVK